MKFRKAALWIVAAALAAPVAFAANSPVKPGKWQMTMQMEMPGMPFQMPPITLNQCITREMAENPESTLPSASQRKNNDCRVGDYKLEGNTVSWTVNCPKEKLTGTGSITYTDNAYAGQMKMKMDEQEMSVKYKGKYLGACEE